MLLFFLDAHYRALNSESQRVFIVIITCFCIFVSFSFSLPPSRRPRRHCLSRFSLPCTTCSTRPSRCWRWASSTRTWPPSTRPSTRRSTRQAWTAPCSTRRSSSRAPRRDSLPAAFYSSQHRVSTLSSYSTYYLRKIPDIKELFLQRNESKESLPPLFKARNNNINSPLDALMLYLYPALLFFAGPTTQ